MKRFEGPAGRAARKARKAHMRRRENWMAKLQAGMCRLEHLRYLRMWSQGGF